MQVNIPVEGVDVIYGKEYVRAVCHLAYLAICRTHHAKYGWWNLQQVGAGEMY